MKFAKGLESPMSFSMLRELRNFVREDTKMSNGGSGVGGWVIWIGILVLVNVLSYFLDWGFWLY